MFSGSPSRIGIGWLGCALVAWVAGCCIWVSAARGAQREPTASDLVQARFADIEREIARLNAAGQKAEAEAMEGKLKYFRDRMEGKAKSTSTEAELHLVGFYEGREGGDGRPGSVNVMVERTDRPAVVAICAYDKCRWKVQIAPGANVRKIILAGYHEQRLEGVPEGVAVEMHVYEAGDRNYFHCYKRDGAEYTRTLEMLHQITGLNVATFQGEYQAKDQAYVVGPGNPQWVAQRVLSEMESLHREATAFERSRMREMLRPIRFSAVFWKEYDPNLRRLTGEWSELTPVGPIVGKGKRLPEHVEHVAVDPRGPTHYAVASHGLQRLNLVTGTMAELKPNDFDLPRISWPCGLAFDTKRNRVVLATLHGVGFLYSYSPDQNKWSVIGKLNNMGLRSLTYSAEEDSLFAFVMDMGGSGRASIIQFGPDGRPIRSMQIAQRIPCGELRPASGHQLLVAGRQMLLLIPPLPDVDSGDFEARPRCFVIDSKTGNITARLVMEPQPDTPATPMTEADLNRLWEALADSTEGTADLAMWRMAAGGQKTIAFLKAKLPPPVPADAQKVRELISKLDADSFQEREAAMKALMQMGSAADPELKKAREGAAAPETKTRIDTILKQFADAGEQEDPGKIEDLQQRREARAVWVLARMGTPEAVEFLRELARGPAGPRAAQARAAMKHIEKR